MTPIFDVNCDFVAWLSAEGDVFDVNENWIGFVRNNNLFNAETLNWLGTFVEDTLVDKEGRPAGWLKGADVKSHNAPFTPIRHLRQVQPDNVTFPITPIRPIKPQTPEKGWSPLSWQEFWAQDFFN